MCLSLCGVLSLPDVVHRKTLWMEHMSVRGYTFPPVMYHVGDIQQKHDSTLCHTIF